MAKKPIATALLLAMVAWAEMSLAPMLLMPVWHVQQTAEMADHLAGHHAMLGGHRCCPAVSKTGNPAILDVATGSLPCHNEHRCCFLRGPQNIPAPVSAGNKVSREIALAEIAAYSPAQAASRVSPMNIAAPDPPPGLLGMVLRV